MARSAPAAPADAPAEEGRNEGCGRLLLPDPLLSEEEKAVGYVAGFEVAQQEGYRPVLPAYPSEPFYHPSCSATTDRT